MAHCLSDSLLGSLVENGCTTDNEIDYEDFCESFNFANSESCWVCNGYYGPSFGEPLCGTCHAFLCPTAAANHDPVTQVSDDEDSGNDEPPYSIIDKERQERDERDEGQQMDEAEENDDNRFRFDPPPPMPPRNLNQYIDLLTEAVNDDRSVSDINKLPVEVLIQVFAHLDDLSLWNASEVCTQWRKVIQTHVPARMFQKYTYDRFPLFSSLINVPNWFNVYSALMSSCFCRTCLTQMALKTPLSSRNNCLRAQRLRGDVRSLDADATEGIDATPLDAQLSHWQASISGPVGSPYEGGKFFLYIIIPNYYPMLPPRVRFLTKIVHPNVSRHGDVGIDIIQHNWSLALTISKLLLSVQSLLTDPFTEICMEPELGRMYENERPKFNALARRWTWKYAMCEIMPTP